MVDDLLHPATPPQVIVGDIVDPVFDELLEGHLDDLPFSHLDRIEESALENLRGDVRDLAKVGRIQKDLFSVGLEAPGGMDVAREHQQKRIVVAVGAKPRRAGGSGGGDAVMDAVRGLMGDDDVRLHRLEKAVHLVVLVIHPDPRPVSDDVAFGDAARPDVRSAVARDPQTVELIPVEVEVVLVQGGVAKIHVVVARQAENSRVRLQRDDVFKHLVLLLHDPPCADRL